MNKEYVAQYNFFPLIHIILKERKYKKIIDHKGSQRRAHSYIDKKGAHKRTIKPRPLHYASHMDALIFAYYAFMLQAKYEERIENFPELKNSIIAYRRIPIAEGAKKNKGTIHFAHEIFEEIKKRSLNDGECVVLAFDIKSFFSSLDHKCLKGAWLKLFETKKLSDDHYNVFKAATKFSYIMLDELRQSSIDNNRKKQFDEKHLAQIRNHHGIISLFESVEEFRNKIRSRELTIYKYPFRNKKTGETIGIPQGLPISAILANLYLWEFDLMVQTKLVDSLGCHYRRYSDDIAIVCKVDQKDIVEQIVLDAIKECVLEISKEKTELFHFKNMPNKNKPENVICYKYSNKAPLKESNFVYLGFAFNGRNAYVKSANLSRFYRRMIYSVKRKAKRAVADVAENPGTKPVIFRRQLYKLYSAANLSKVKFYTRRKKLVKTPNGGFQLISKKAEKTLQANYFNYVKRASKIMNNPKIKDQLDSHKRIFNAAIKKHLEHQLKKLK